MSFAEQQTEWIISNNLVNKEWVVDVNSNKNVFFQKMDYACLFITIQSIAGGQGKSLKALNFFANSIYDGRRIRREPRD